MRKSILPTLSLVVARIVAWIWTAIAGVGGLALLIHQGPLPITNGWFAMFSGIAACPLTASLLKKYAGVTVPGRVQLAVSLLIMVAGRVAVVVVLHRPFLPGGRFGLALLVGVAVVVVLHRSFLPQR